MDDQAGSRFETLYDEYFPKVRAYAARTFGSNDAEDIAQETMLRARDQMELFAGDRPVWPWLAVVARRVGIDIRRRQRAEVMENGRLAELAPLVHDHSDVVAFRVDTSRVLRRATPLLTRRDRQTLALHLQGRSIGEIASLTGSTNGAVRQRLYRIRQQLDRQYRDPDGTSFFVGDARPIGWSQPSRDLPGALVVPFRRAASRRSRWFAAAAAVLVTSAALAAATNLSRSERTLIPAGPHDPIHVSEPPVPGPHHPGIDRTPSRPASAEIAVRHAGGRGDPEVLPESPSPDVPPCGPVFAPNAAPPIELPVRGVCMPTPGAGPNPSQSSPPTAGRSGLICSGGTSPPLASTSSACTSFSASSPGGPPSMKLTTQSAHASPRTAQPSQSITHSPLIATSVPLVHANDARQGV